MPPGSRAAQSCILALWHDAGNTCKQLSTYRTSPPAKAEVKLLPGTMMNTYLVSPGRPHPSSGRPASRAEIRRGTSPPPVLINGSAKPGRLRRPGGSVPGQLPCPGQACRWRSVGGERGPGARARDGASSSPCWRLLSRAKEAAGERLPRCRGPRSRVLAGGRGAEWLVTGCAGFWRCCRRGEMGGRRPGCAGHARRSWG
jgi:hypothetical protein